MSCETESKTIGDNEYSVTQWPATKAMTMKLRLIKAFGASIAIIAGQIKTGDDLDNSDNDANAFAAGLSSIFNNNSPEEIVSLIKESIINVSCNGTKITDSSFDQLFSGDDLLEAYKVFLFVLKVNYSNLMKGQLAEDLLVKVQEKL